MSPIVIISKLRTWGLVGAMGALRRVVFDALSRRKLYRLARKPATTPPQRGVTLIVDFTGKAAISKTMRDFAHCLKLAGIPVQVYDLRDKPEIPECDYRDYLTPPNEFDFHKYTHIVELFRTNVPPEAPERHARIVFHDSAAGVLEFAPYLDTPDDIIAMSDFNAEYLSKALLRSRKVHKIVYPFMMPNVERTPRDEMRRKYGYARDDFIVFFNFDFGSYYRKNLPASIRAFAKAFADVPNAKLLYKTKGANDHPKMVAEMKQLAAELGIADRMQLLTAYLPRKDVDGLTDMCDVYLSLHASEGFGIGMAEAMALGHPVVCTNWSANTEFCRPDNSMPVPYKLVPIQPWEYPVCLKEWASADVDAAAVALRKLYDDPALRESLGQKAKAFIADHFSTAHFKRDIDAFLDS